MPRRSYRKRSGSKRKSQNQNQQQNQSGGAGEQQQIPEISQATLNQAAVIAKQVMGSMMQSKGVTQGGGSAAGASPAVAGGAELPAGLQSAMAGGAGAGAVAGAVAGADAFSSLKGSSIMGGRRRARRGRGGKSQSQSQSQKGGMVPGLLTAVETALVPLGLYLGQKALQSRSSSGSRSLGKSFDFRRASRRTRRRR